QTGGFVLGGDISATNLMGGDWRLGLAGGYTNDSIAVNQRGSSGTFESVFGGVYAGASFGSLQLRAGALYGSNTTSTTRQVAFPGFSEALSSSNGGYTAQGFGEVGYRIQMGGLGLGGGARASVEPFAGAAAFLIHQNGFTEVGGTSALTASARDFNVQTTTLGVRGELAFASMPLTLKGTLGWRHAYGEVVPSVLLTFQGGAQAFSVSGVPIDRDAFVAEAGIEYSLTSALSVGVSYSGQYGQRATDNAFKGNVNLRSAGEGGGAADPSPVYGRRWPSRSDGRMRDARARLRRDRSRPHPRRAPATQGLIRIIGWAQLTLIRLPLTRKAPSPARRAREKESSTGCRPQKGWY
ncbi:MAG: autotransporter domain-containing protein, partial [Hyphomicrobiales bacterium]|nr:autotransporter domain-containing protein [Hyphomicrobiales bacterium]